MSSNKTHRAFRISNDLWNQFTEITQREGITATAAITRFLQTCVNNGSVHGAVYTDDQGVNTAEFRANSVNTKSVDTESKVNTSDHVVNTEIQIDNVRGLRSVLTKLEQGVNISAEGLRETVERLEDDLTKSLLKVEGLEMAFRELEALYKQVSVTKDSTPANLEVVVETQKPADSNNVDTLSPILLSKDKSKEDPIEPG